MFIRHLILVLAIILPFYREVLADDTFRVGVNLPLSGVAAAFGEAARNGIEMAVATDPAKFTKIRFLFEDNQYDAKRAIAAYQKLRFSDNANLIFAWGEAPVLAVAPLAERDKFPLIALSTDPKPLRNYQYTVRFINSTSDYAEKLVQYLRQQGIKKIGMVVADDPYYTPYIDAIRSHLRPDESIKIVANYLPSEMDFKPAILKAKGESFDILGIFLFVGQISNFYRQAAALGYKPLTFGADDFESKTEIAAAQGGMNNAVFALNKMSSDFATRYLARFGHDSHLTYAGNGYDLANFIAQIVSWNSDQTNAQLTNSQMTNAQIIERISTLQLPPGALGKGEFVRSQEEGQYFRFPIVIKKVVGAGVEVVSE